MGFLLTFAIKNARWIALAVGILLAWLALVAVKHSYDDGKREEGRAEVQAVFDAYRKTAQERTTAITLAWDQKRIEADEAAKGRDDERTKRLAIATQRAQSLPAAVAAVVVPAAALGVLDDAIRASDPAPATGPADTPAATPTAPAAPAADGSIGLLTQWALGAVDAYNNCRDLLTGWQEFYAGLRSAQPVESP